MEVGEILEQLSYHSQMASGWEHLQEYLKSYVSDSVTQVIPVKDGVSCTQVSLNCLQEFIKIAEEKADIHRVQIDELRSMKANVPSKVTKLKKGGDA